MLTGLAAMLGAFFILDDPIFNGLAISLIFGIFVSTLLTLVVIPVAVLRGLSQAPRPNLSRRTSMTSWQIVRLVAGIFILLSLALGIPGSPIFVSQWWLAFTAFVGANLLQSALTRWCLMETIVRKLGAREGC